MRKVVKVESSLLLSGLFNQLCIYPDRVSEFNCAEESFNSNEKFERVFSLKKKNVYRPDIPIYKVFQKAALKNNSGEELTIYIVRRLMDYIRPLICAGIGNGKYFMVPELREIVGDNSITKYIDSLELVSSFDADINICECRCREKKGYIFHAKSSDGVNEDWSISEMSTTYTGQERCYTRFRKAVNEGQKEYIHRINDVAVLYARAAIYNALQSYINGADEDDAVYCKIKTICKQRIVRAEKNGYLYVRESFVPWAKKIFGFLGIDIPISSETQQNRCFEISPASGQFVNAEVLSLFGFGCIGQNSRIFKGFVPCKRKGCAYTSAFDENLTDAFEVLLKRAEVIQGIRKYEREQGNDYAHSYEEKKYIPKYIRQEMRSSSFLDSFGHVEFDEDCDMTKVELVCKEWNDIKELLFAGCKKDVSLRFRKLGNHKASGLYYPFFKCLCVDIRTPSSMIHEVFHMIDHEGGYLSDKYAFSHILDRYSECVKRIMKKDTDVAKVLGSKNKYNLDYYLTPTEVFARCGEIYMGCIVGLKTSLLPEDLSGFAYPQDEVLYAAIKGYFDVFFGVEVEKKEERKAGEA